ncbi:MAG: cobalamin biosynthesis protein [Selenomonadaceae bacterium]|nr:cobalamin biosynthesis protein [Selenomonadaceae bacterium]
MKIAIFTASRQGTELACMVATALGEETTIFCPERIKEVAAKNDSGVIGYERLAVAVAEAVFASKALVFIMATGIAVRLIAPYLRDKLRDPAVVVMDDRGEHVISLLSGHMGGANELTLRIAQIMKADPVITTATDLRGIVAPDAVARFLGLRPYPKENIKYLNGAMLDGKKITYFLDQDFPQLEKTQAKLLELDIIAYDITLEQFKREHLGKASGDCDSHKVIITSKPLNFRTKINNNLLPGQGAASPLWGLGQSPNIYPPHVLSLTAYKLIAGVGCRRGVSQGEVMMALHTACHALGQNIDAIYSIASVTIKEDEVGLKAAADCLGVRRDFFSPQELSEIIQKHKLKESPMVKEKIGVGNVAEAAALAAAQEGELALKKKIYCEKVTVALVWGK